MRKGLKKLILEIEKTSFITKADCFTSLSGIVSVKLYQYQSGRWFGIISPTDSGIKSQSTCWISSHNANEWLKKYNFNLQHRKYFGINGGRLWPERQVLVAERKSPKPTNSHDLINVERLFYHPKKGWCLKQSKESVLIPLTAKEAARFVRSLQQKKGHKETPLPPVKQYLYEGEHSRHRRIA